MAIKLVTGLLTVLFIGSMASAGVYYEYEGNPFQFIVDSTPPNGTYVAGAHRITGYVQFASALPPNLVDATVDGAIISYSFSDGRLTYSSQHSDPVDFENVYTDSGGNITQWEFTANIVGVNPGDREGEIATINRPGWFIGDNTHFWECLTSGCGSITGTDGGGNEDIAGVFPEPNGTAGMLVGVSLLVLLPGSRRARA